MVIAIDTTTLCAGGTRNTNGSPVGPDNVVIDETPGVNLREYVGADRVKGEYVRCDHGSISFSVTRVYATVAAAAAYALTGHRSEPKAGALKVTPDGGTETTLFANAAVTRKQIAQVGCAVVVSYTIEG